MYARTEKNRIDAAIIKAVLVAKNRNIKAAAMRRRIASIRGHFA